MADIPSAADLRRWAMKYGAQADETKDLTERQRLFRMREALLQLADTEDWLRGTARPTPPLQPTR